MRNIAMLIGASIIAAAYSAKIVSLDPTGTVEAQAEIVELFENCKIDVLVDVRSKYYNSNLRLEGGRHYANGLETDFEAEWNTLIETEKVQSIGIYCWTQPWQSTHGADWLQQFLSDPRYENVTIYDVKGLQYLSQIKGMCPYIQTPNCNSTDTACRARWVKDCENEQARSTNGDFCREEAERKAKEAEEIARQVAQQKALEEAARKAVEEARKAAEQARKEAEKKNACAGMFCTEDLCEDGLPRRVIGDNCCACPEVKDDVDTSVGSKPWYTPGEPGFLAIVVVSSVLTLLVIVAVVVARKLRRRREERDAAETESSKNMSKRVYPDTEDAPRSISGPKSLNL